ncbi:MAG: TIGR02281 family clan AA aspartic protease [Magnetococcales bacterium]|nr:TIGR02281 family clan AA aspartic protease [Magnetococcales bacterium]
MEPGPDSSHEPAPGTREAKDRPCCLKRGRRHRSAAREAHEKGTWSWLRFGVIAGLLVTGVLLLHHHLIGSLTGGHLPETLGGPLLLALVLGWFLASYTVRQLLEKIHRGLVWWVVILSLILGFTFKTEMLSTLDQVMANLVPRFGNEEQTESATFYRAANGHFYIEALVNRQPVSFLVDTSASAIILPPRIARKLGFRLENLSHGVVFPTSSGTIRAASVQLDDFRMGDLHLQGVAAYVNGTPMRTPLLGMQFFNDTLVWEVKGDVMIVRKRPGTRGSPVAAAALGQEVNAPAQEH